MGFRLGDIAERTEHGVLRGIQREIACECWFTSKGRSIPKIIKVMDEEGMLHTIREIQLLTSEEKTYSGIRTVEHLCRINLGGRLETVKLIFTKETCKWSLVEL
ncbi:MAG: thioredoxin family protein [Lachnospiraceae bacterium]|nr:thioredoxin family protein [Lachnospiraceae bacterium]MDE6186429.1 thioredoxin family protein [Lachnospiraceae bacterium]